ncbi:hypothetical protein [Rhodococcus sp. RD6.2]|uniref:hypothetical protein n=1 Tax=Rhodococcus sp. RD6.2 TaxID=260936 RepID=UPI0012ECEE08|nr:hypothetical protein [Rhodococcus sp. RD6.2]
MLFAVVAVPLLLGGCGGYSGQVITPGFESLPRCAVREEIPVGELDQDRLHDCNPEGLRIRMPDGRVAQVDAVGTTYSTSSSDPGLPGEITVINWGVEGVGVAFRSGDERRVWGSTDQARRKQEAIPELR